MREEKSSQLIQNAYSESAASYAARNWNLHLKQKFNWITRKSNRYRNKIRFQKFGSDSRTRNSKYSRASAVEGSSKASSLPSLQGPHHLSNILYFKMINLINSKHFLFWNVRLRPKRWILDVNFEKIIMIMRTCDRVRNCCATERTSDYGHGVRRELRNCALRLGHPRHQTLLFWRKHIIETIQNRI